MSAPAETYGFRGRGGRPRSRSSGGTSASASERVIVAVSRSPRCPSQGGFDFAVAEPLLRLEDRHAKSVPDLLDVPLCDNVHDGRTAISAQDAKVPKAEEAETKWLADLVISYSYEFHLVDALAQDTNRSQEPLTGDGIDGRVNAEAADHGPGDRDRGDDQGIERIYEHPAEPEDHLGRGGAEREGHVDDAGRAEPIGYGQDHAGSALPQRNFLAGGGLDGAADTAAGVNLFVHFSLSIPTQESCRAEHWSRGSWQGRELAHAGCVGACALLEQPDLLQEGGRLANLLVSISRIRDRQNFSGPCPADVGDAALLGHPIGLSYGPRIRNDAVLEARSEYGVEFESLGRVDRRKPNGVGPIATFGTQDGDRG